MESITDTKWDVLIAGTGLPQSLLALSLSRSDKKVLHVDKNEYYGGQDAALTLQDAQDWIEQVNAGNARPYNNASVTQPHAHGDGRLGFSRSYSLALSPQIVYTRSALLPTLVSSKVYRQLEFLAVGSWFVYGRPAAHSEPALVKIPNSREDVFADKSLDMKSKRALISFLRTIRDPDEQARVLEKHGSEPLSEYLTARYKLAETLQSAVNALTLSPEPTSKTTVEYALPRISRHLASIGVFGAGFGAVVPKWGGLAEIAQVGCRAQAVGGGIYMLGKGVQSFKAGSANETTVSLNAETEISAKVICSSTADIPSARKEPEKQMLLARCIAIVAATLEQLFVGGSEGGPRPTVAIVCFPADSLLAGGVSSAYPVYLMVHSSETGECPAGQCVIYASVRGGHADSPELLRQAISKLLTACSEVEDSLLWLLSFKQVEETGAPIEDVASNAVHFMAGTSTDLAFDDVMLQKVRQTWQSITGCEDGFMDFEDREVGAYDDDES